ncbi:MAG: 2-oxo acid dehydrogenase subunit E2 [Bacillota bacterium]|jgi:pyruvate/2-oxoglutarate dehydrogenase complex dihydrolipoamide acyltransferase (E2) component
MGEKRVKLSGARKYISDHMLNSILSYPQARGFIKVDMTEILKMRDEYISQGQKIAMSAFMIKIISTALKKFPSLNARLERDEIIYYDHINCGIGIDIGGGLYVLVIKDADQKTLLEIDKEFRAYLDKLKNNTLTLDDMKGGTFTITNFCNSKPEFFTSIINNDECIIVGIGGLKKQVVVTEDDQIVIRPMCMFIVNMNHSITDGRDINGFMETIYDICQEPQSYF